MGTVKSISCGENEVAKFSFATRLYEVLTKNGKCAIMKRGTVAG